MSDASQLMERVRQLEAGLPPENVDVPYLSGDARVGGELTCTMGNWNCMSSGGTYAYAFSGGGVATDNRYVPAAGDADTDVTCIVTATNPNGALAAPPSNPVHIAAAGDVVRSTILTAGGTAPRPVNQPTEEAAARLAEMEKTRLAEQDQRARPGTMPAPAAPAAMAAPHRETAHEDAKRDENKRK